VDDLAMHLRRGMLLVITFVLVFGGVCLAQAISSGQPNDRTVVVFGDDLHYPPFSFRDAQGQPAGFSVELAMAVGELMGWEIEFDLDHWSRVVDKLESGEIDVIAGMFYTPERAQRFDFAIRHAVASGDVFTRYGDGVRSLEELRGQRVAVQEGDIVHEYLRAQNLDIEFLQCPTVVEALRMVADGEADYAAVLRVPAYFSIAEYGLNDLRGSGLILGEYDYSMAVRKGDTALLLALNEGLQALNATGRYAEIYQKWISVHEPNAFRDALSRYGIVMGVLAALAVVAFIWVASLRQAVERRTSDLEAANQQLSSQFELLKQTEQDLASERDLLHTTLLSVGEAVIVTDCLGAIIMFNPAAESLTGWSAKQAIGKDFHEVFRLASGLDPLTHVLTNECSMELEKESLISRNGQEIIVAGTFAPILDRGNQVRGGIVVFRDITAQVESQRHIEYLSYCDSLTGLYNRRWVQMQLKHFNDAAFLPFSVIIADMNGLKLTNDAFGHAVGDELLKSTSAVIQEVIGDSGVCARLGGDELIVLLPNTDRQTTQNLVRRIREIASQRQVAGLVLSVSLGWETREDLDRTIHDVIKHAEDDMYKHKLLDQPVYRARAIAVILQSLYDRTPREEDHSLRVAHICELIGEALDMDMEQIEKLHTIGMLHDIGKISIEREILEKPGPLTKDEYVHIQRHAELGYRIIGAMSEMVDIAEYILVHHERFDGSGYPRGLRGRQIPYYSRIVAVADAWDAMTSPRPYRDAMTIEQAAAELYANAGTQFDPRIVEVFLEKVLPKLAADEAAVGGPSR